MEQTGNLKNLAERMKEKAEQERMRTEAVFSEQLRILRDGLQASSQSALRTMSDAMAQEIMGTAEKLDRHYRILSSAFGRQWLCLAALGMALCLGMLAGGWTLAMFGTQHLTRYRSELAQLQRDCQSQRETLVNLKNGTWGLELHTAAEGRFIVFPPGKTTDGKMWTVNDRNAIRMEE